MSRVTWLLTLATLLAEETHWGDGCPALVDATPCMALPRYKQTDALRTQVDGPVVGTGAGRGFQYRMSAYTTERWGAGRLTLELS